MSNILPKILVLNLGKMCFKKTYCVQKEAAGKIAELYKSQTINNYLFLVEHTPVYTVGIRNKQYVKDSTKLRHLGADYIETDRGGLITFHGPGQLVAYPVIYLGDFNAKRSIRWYVRQLENVLIDTCDCFGLKANTTDDVGVWIEDRKIAAIGIHASRYITTHGIAINCNVDLTWFSHIVACGLEDKEVTSLSKELNTDITVDETVPKFLECFQRHFLCEIQHTDSLTDT